MEEKRGGARVVLPLVIGAAIAAAVWFAVARMQAGKPAATASVPATTEAAKEAAEPAKVESDATGTEAGDADDSLLSQEADTAAAAPMREKTAETSRFAELRAKSHPLTQALMDIWAEEDEVYAKAPRYDSVKADMQGKAEEILKSINRSDTEAVIALAQKELEAFWDAGGLASPESYEHGYVARAIAESALERESENFALLSLLRESISVTTPLHSAAYKANPEMKKDLWPVVEKQREMILAGRVPLSSETMCAMVDWAHMASLATKDVRAPLPGYQWLRDNADAAGWSSIKPYFQQAVDGVKSGGGISIQLYTTPYDGKPHGELERLMATTGRMLPSVKGPAKYAAMRKAAWEIPAEERGK
jgi:hypothetical protein